MKLKGVFTAALLSLGVLAAAAPADANWHHGYRGGWHGAYRGGYGSHRGYGYRGGYGWRGGYGVRRGYGWRGGHGRGCAYHLITGRRVWRCL